MHPRTFARIFGVLAGVAAFGLLFYAYGRDPATTKRLAAPPAVSPVDPAAADPTAGNETGGAGDAHVVAAEGRRAADGTWTFAVTVRYADTGGDDYADGWDLVLPDGERVLKRNPDDRFTRPLAHPHVNEQPFTRSQSGLTLAEGVTTFTVRAHERKDGFGGKTLTPAIDGETARVVPNTPAP